MQGSTFSQGVKPGGLTTNHEIQVLICYILSNVNTVVTKKQLEEVLLGEELVNYFAMAENFAILLKQGLIEEAGNGCAVTAKGRTVGNTLADEVPKTVRNSAINGVIRAQQFAARKAVYQSEISKAGQGNEVRCEIVDENGVLFNMSLYMPDALTAEAVKNKFTWQGDTVYKLVLAALTGNTQWAKDAVETLTGNTKPE